MPPLLADFTHARPCKPFCEKYLTLPLLTAPKYLTLPPILDAMEEWGTNYKKRMAGES